MIVGTTLVKESAAAVNSLEHKVKVMNTNPLTSDKKRISELEKLLSKYVEEDDTYEGGKWEEHNEGFLKTKRDSILLLSTSSNKKISSHHKSLLKESQE